MKLHSEILSKTETESSANLDGEIYVRLGHKSFGWRVFLMTAALLVSAGAAVLGAVAQVNSVSGSKRYTRGATECPGMTPAQKAAAAASNR